MATLINETLNSIATALLEYFVNVYDPLVHITDQNTVLYIQAFRKS